MINHQDLVSNNMDSPKVGVYIAFGKAEPDELDTLCEPLLNNVASKNQFDSVKCEGNTVYPVLWAGLATGFKAQKKYFNALVMNDSTKIDKTIVVEFFQGGYKKLNARVVTSKSDNYFHVDVASNSNQPPTRAGLKVNYIKFPTGDALTPS